jgi:hypothetical protein
MCAFIPRQPDRIFNHYLDKQMFVSLAKRRPTEKMTDMVAYDYENDSAISVEIESMIEAHNHEEQVRLNMTKWRQMGFSEFHMWSKSPKIARIKQSLGKEADGTKVFLINKDNSYTMM